MSVIIHISLVCGWHNCPHLCVYQVNLKLSLFLTNLFFQHFAEFVCGEVGTPLNLGKSNIAGAFYTGPYLDGTEVTNVTTQIGTHAYLPCKVCLSRSFFSVYFIDVWITRWHGPSAYLLCFRCSCAPLDLMWMFDLKRVFFFYFFSIWLQMRL